MRGEEGDEFRGGEAGVGHASKDIVDILLWNGYEASCGWNSRVRATREELEAGCTRAVRNRNGASKLYQITCGDGEVLEERLETVDSVLDTVIGVCRGKPKSSKLEIDDSL